MPDGSAVIFAVTGDVGASNTAISHTAGVIYVDDTNAGNNTSTLATRVYNAVIDESRYEVDIDAILDALASAGNPRKNKVWAYPAYEGVNAEANGGVINLVYTLVSGDPVPGVGTSFTVPVTYSDLNNRYGADNQWQYVHQGLDEPSNPAQTPPEMFGASSINLVPNTARAAGGLFYDLPGNGRNGGDFPSPPYSIQMDPLFMQEIASGDILQLGTFSLQSGDFPTSSSPDCAVVDHRLHPYARVRGIVSPLDPVTGVSTAMYSGFWMKPLADIETYSYTNGYIEGVEVMPGDEYMWRYSAFDTINTPLQHSAATGNSQVALGVRFGTDSHVTFASVEYDEEEIDDTSTDIPVTPVVPGAPDTGLAITHTSSVVFFIPGGGVILVLGARMAKRSY